jgi:hypothetical protein
VEVGSRSSRNFEGEIDGGFDGEMSGKLGVVEG